MPMYSMCATESYVQFQVGTIHGVLLNGWAAREIGWIYFVSLFLDK